MEKLAFTLARLQHADKGCLAAWLQELPLDQFALRCVRPVQYYLANLAQRQVSSLRNPCVCHTRLSHLHMTCFSITMLLIPAHLSTSLRSNAHH